MSVVHFVSENETLLSIAEAYGFDPETIWNLPVNAALCDARINMNFLLPGDSIFVLDRKQKEVSGIFFTDKSIEDLWVLITWALLDNFFAQESYYKYIYPLRI